MLRWLCPVLIALSACSPATAPAQLTAPTSPDPRQAARDTALAALAAPFVDAFSNTGPALAPDGRVVFVSSRDGLPQLYVGDAAHPDQPPHRLPGPAERMFAPRILPDGVRLVFVSDVGSDQKFHIFRVGLDGSGLTDLTPADGLLRSPPHVAKRTGALIYTAHTLDDQSTRVMVQPPDGPPREVYRDPKVGTIAGVTDDGARALYLRWLSDSDQVLVTLDLATGAQTQLFPAAGQVTRIGDAGFTPDGAHVITATEARDRPLRVVVLDAATGAEQARYDEATARTAALDQIAISPAGDRVVLELDAGDHSELRMLDPHDLHLLPVPQLPLAEVTLGDFDPSGGRLAVTIHSPAGPGDIAALDVASGQLVALRNEQRSGLEAPPRATIEHVRAFDGLSIPVNVYLPNPATRAPNSSAGPPARLPTLVLVHGGPSGNAKIGWSPTIGFWSAMGFAVIAPNIRGSSGFGMAYEEADDREHRVDALRDMESVNRWARAQPWCDGDRLVIGGISYGGYMTLLALGHQPALWRAGIDGSGMSNLRTMEQLEDQLIRSFDDTEFGVLGKDDALLIAWSPITAVDHIVAPVFVYQGVRDPVTPQHEADQIVAALRNRRIPVEYMLLGNEGHGLTRRENLIAYFARSYRFLSEHMKLSR
ncbi:MAG TPA: prolyl oligopeptidase family serine peptidase [Kofleriaceae bacterium]|jgi:dipeptidyl aminopeptidase/acylaminoacyl peptidase|nr:prolyl oligopeptidase family serine peptidase [Kofleriaceae bacterium]